MTETAEEGEFPGIARGRREGAVRMLLSRLRILRCRILFWQSVILEKE